MTVTQSLYQQLSTLQTVAADNDPVLACPLQTGWAVTGLVTSWLILLLVIGGLLVALGGSALARARN